MQSSEIVHRRTLDISMAEAGDSLQVTGRLRDERPWEDDPARGSVLHDMIIHLTVGPDLVITAASTEMASFPHAECPLVTARFADVVGLSVARGYSRSLRTVFGGVTGCAHVYELARAAGAAIVQGTISRRSRRGQMNDNPEGMKAALAGTCHVWQVDGPAPRKLDLGWRPDGTTFPVAPVEHFEQA